METTPDASKSRFGDVLMAQFKSKKNNASRGE